MRTMYLGVSWMGVVLFATSCRILAMDVACRADRDCPSTLPRCSGDTADGGYGACAEETDGGEPQRSDGGAMYDDGGADDDANLVPDGGEAKDASISAESGPNP